MSRLLTLLDDASNSGGGAATDSLGDIDFAFWFDWRELVEDAGGSRPSLGGGVRLWTDKRNGETFLQNGAAKPTLAATGIQLDNSTQGMVGTGNLVLPYTLITVEQATSYGGHRTINGSTINALISGSRSTANSVYDNVVVSDYYSNDLATHVISLRADLSNNAWAFWDMTDQTNGGSPAFKGNDFNVVSLGTSGIAYEGGACILSAVFGINDAIDDSTLLRIVEYSQLNYF